MGEKIQTHQFSESDFANFKQQLTQETQHLQQLILDGCLNRERYQMGFELEFQILNKDYQPAFDNIKMIKNCNNANLTTEIVRSNIEINTDPFLINNENFKRGEAALNRIWKNSRNVLQKHGLMPASIGTLPSIGRSSARSIDVLTQESRFLSLDGQLAQMRQNQPFKITINGEEHLDFEANHVGIIGITSAFQIHLRIPAKVSARYYNAALIIAAPLLAVGCNSPLVFDEVLWSETRIPLFETVLNSNGHCDVGRKRVTLGENFIKDTLAEVFTENLEYPILLPASNSQPVDKFSHVALHNGTIWRWVRPVIDHDQNGEPHVRIEFRVLPSGTSITDMMANVALYLGLVRYYATLKTPPEKRIDFNCVKQNFYQAAKQGLNANFSWLNNKKTSAKSLLKNTLLINARKGLLDMGFSEQTIQDYLSNIKQRVMENKTGSSWQREHFNQQHHSIKDFLAEYQENQNKDSSILDWE